MRRLWMGSVVVGVLVWLAAGSGWLRFQSTAGAASRVKWIEKNVGAVPKAWGDLVGVTTQNLQTVLVFKDAKGTIRRIQWNANGGLSSLVHVLKREY